MGDEPQTAPIAVAATPLDRRDFPMLVGFALFQAWVTLCFFTPQLFPDAVGDNNVYMLSLAVSVVALAAGAWKHHVTAGLLQRPLCFFTPQLFPDAVGDNNVYMLSLAVSVVALAAGAWKHHVTAGLLQRPSVRWGLAACAAVGTALIPFCFGSSPVQLALTAVAALLTGLAIGFFNVAWCQAFVHRGNAVDFTLSIVTSSVAIYVLTNLAYTPAVSSLVMLALSVATPLVSALLLNLNSSADHGGERIVVPIDAHPRRSYLLRLCVGIFAISFADEFMRNYYLEGTDLSFYSSQLNLLILVFKIVVSIMTVSAIRRMQYEEFSFLYRASFMLALIAALLLPFNLLILVFKIVVSIMTVSAIRRMQYEEFSFLYRASFMLALIAALLLPFAESAGPVGYALANCGAFVFKLTVFLVFSFLYRASFMLALIAALLLPFAESAGPVGYALANCGAFVFKLTVFLVCLEYCARGASAALTFCIVRGVWSLDLLLGSGLYAMNDQLAGIGIDPGILTIALVVAVAAAYMFVFSNGSNGSLDLLAPEPWPLARKAETPSEQPTPVSRRDTDAACSELAARANLSPREADVLRLLARGRTTARIQDELGISANTVNTHVRHVFQKLGVHSRQELLDVVEKERG